MINPGQLNERLYFFLLLVMLVTNQENIQIYVMNVARSLQTQDLQIIGLTGTYEDHQVQQWAFSLSKKKKRLKP